ncbi:MAG: hypothetical protein ACTSR3_01050 [Candidatus Helarchaeota archaeon]
MDEYKKIIRKREFYGFMWKITYWLVKLAKISDFFERKNKEYVDKYYEYINDLKDE